MSFKYQKMEELWQMMKGDLGDTATKVSWMDQITTLQIDVPKEILTI